MPTLSEQLAAADSVLLPPIDPAIDIFSPSFYTSGLHPVDAIPYSVSPPDPYGDEGYDLYSPVYTSYDYSPSSIYNNGIRDAAEIPGASPQANTLQRATWDNTAPSFGWNSGTLSAAASTISTWAGLSAQQTSSRQSAYDMGRVAGNYDMQAAQYANMSTRLNQEASTNYRIAAMNMESMRRDQSKYLSSQTVSAVRSGFALDSNSVTAVRQDTMPEFERQLSSSRDQAEQERQNTAYAADNAQWQGQVAQTNASNARRQQALYNRQAKSAGVGKIFSVLGAGGGGFLGGPVGMSIGAKAGGGLGYSLGKNF